MISLGRSSVGRARGRRATLLPVQLHLEARTKGNVAGHAEWSLKRTRAFAASNAVNPPALRTLSSMTSPPGDIAAGTSAPGSNALVPEKLVTMVPWVPAPFQPFMDKLHPIMIKERRPLAFLGIDTTTNFGALCGHASFAILTAAYVETDVLTLRVLVLSGSTLNILFNLFRVVGPPVWIPIKWNVGFLALNALMVLLLTRERGEAVELGKNPEKARIYEEIFMPVQLSPVHFLRLMDIAERRVMLKGNDLNQEGRPHKEVFLIVEGTAEVKSEGVAVSHLQSGGFVGSMAFNRFIKATSGAADDGGYYHDGGVIRRTWEAFLQMLRKEGSVVGEVAKSVVGDKRRKRQDTSGMERSHNTITATSDVVAYVWDMHALRAFVKRSPLIGACLQKAISVDLVNKVDQSRDHKEHYRQLLAETLDGGRVTSTERRNLQRYREEHRISRAEHKERLMEHDWTEEEFEAGFQAGVAPKDMSENFLMYENLLRQELAKGEVKPEARMNLRMFRTQAGIDAQEHLLAIEKQGWTADEYEVGGRTWTGGAPAVAPDPDEGDNASSRQAKAEYNINVERYRRLLEDALGGNVIQPEQREALARFREQYAISPEDHEDLLSAEGWTEDDFETGFHRPTFFQQYAALVKRELEKAEVKPPSGSSPGTLLTRDRDGDDSQDSRLTNDKQDWATGGFEDREESEEEESEDMLTQRRETGGASNEKSD